MEAAHDRTVVVRLDHAVHQALGSVGSGVGSGVIPDGNGATHASQAGGPGIGLFFQRLTQDRCGVQMLIVVIQH